MRRPRVVILSFVVATAAFVGSFALHVEGQATSEAPAAFDNQTNGFLDQEEFDAVLEAFEERTTIDTGLGPVFNAQSCTECHQNPVTGGIAQTTEFRAGHNDAAGNFVEAAGGSLINDRAIDASIQERIPVAEDVRTFRTSLTVLGDGFVEAINSNTLVALSNSQAAAQRGQIIQVAVLESPGAVRVGRFGWKNQNSSLLSFSGDAYINEVGVTNRLIPDENTSLGRSVAAFDNNDGANDDPENDIDEFTDFMRATKASPRDLVVGNSNDAITGSNLFNAIGCDDCHTRSITTATPGTTINAGEFVVPAALGNKVIHPFGDFLLHDVGTGDGIVQNGGQSTADKVRTSPLWGVRTRDRHMHDGESLTFTDSILRHGGEATATINRFRALNANQRAQITVFLTSL